MNNTARSALLALLLPAAFAAAAAPQDHWSELFRLPHGGASVGNTTGLAITTNRQLVVADSSRHLLLFIDEDGITATNRPYGSGLSPMVDVDVGDDGTIYVLRNAFLGGADVRLYTPEGAVLDTWTGVAGAADGIAATPEGHVALVHSSQDMVGIYDSTGGVVRQWGENGTGPGNFDDPRGIDVDAEGNIYVTDYGNERVQMFSTNGTYVQEWAVPSSGGAQDVSVGPDGLIALTRYYPGFLGLGMSAGLHILNDEATQLFTASANSSAAPAAAAMGPNGQLVAFADADGIRLMQRGYRTQSAPAIKQLPIPRILSVAQRLASTLVDVDFSVIDPDSPTVAMGALAFDGAEQTLQTALPMTALVEGTATNLGPDRPSGVTNRLTWDASVDWPTNQGSVTIRILAQDDRDLLGFHYITLPTNGPDPELTICRSPVLEEDFQAAWMWLVATNDPAIALSSGIVTAVGGPYDGLALVHPGTTPPHPVTASESEPNDSFGAAETISIASNWVVISGTYSGDSDYFSFSVAEPGTTLWIGVYAQRIGSPFDPRLYLYDSANGTVDEDSDTFGDDPYMTFTCPTNDTYTVRVTRNSTGNGDYVLVISRGPLSGTLLDGRAFLWDRLGVTEATPSELKRAREASTPGSVTQWPPRNQIGGKPKALNEYGFDSGNWGVNAWWVTQ